VSDTLSPRTIITGQTVDFNRHCKYEFGQYVQTHEEHNNSMVPRTTGALAMRPTGNAQGNYYFFSLSMGCILNRSHATKLLMPDDVIDRVHVLAQRQRATAGLLFSDRNRHPDADDEDSDDDDSEYQPDDAADPPDDDNDNDNNPNYNNGDDDSSEDSSYYPPDDEYDSDDDDEAGIPGVNHDDDDHDDDDDADDDDDDDDGRTPGVNTDDYGAEGEYDAAAEVAAEAADDAEDIDDEADDVGDDRGDLDYRTIDEDGDADVEPPVVSTGVGTWDNDIGNTGVELHQNEIDEEMDVKYGPRN
jgi:hypothetical protein